MMTMFSDTEPIAAYTLQQAIDDGVLVEIFKHRWPELSNGRPIVATSHLYSDVSLSGLLEIWNEFVRWRQQTMRQHRNERHCFRTSMNGREVWVIEEEAVFTLLYPADY